MQIKAQIAKKILLYYFEITTYQHSTYTVIRYLTYKSTCTTYCDLTEGTYLCTD